MSNKPQSDYEYKEKYYYSRFELRREKEYNESLIKQRIELMKFVHKLIKDLSSDYRKTCDEIKSDCLNPIDGGEVSNPDAVRLARAQRLSYLTYMKMLNDLDNVHKMITKINDCDEDEQ